MSKTKNLSVIPAAFVALAIVLAPTAQAAGAITPSETPDTPEACAAATPTPTATPGATVTPTPTTTSSATPTPAPSADDCASLLSLVNDATETPAPSSTERASEGELLEATVEPIETPVATETTDPTTAPTPEATSEELMTLNSAPTTDTSRAAESREYTPNTVQCYGSSSADFLCGGGYMNMPGWNIKNHAMGSVGPVSIGVTAGVYQTQLGQTVLIPASGSVNIGAVWGLPMPAQYLGRLQMDVEIGGIRGELTHYPDLADSSTHWKFTRHQAGSAKWVAQGTNLNSLDKPTAGSTSVIWVGANGVEDEARVREVISKMVQMNKNVGANYMVMQLAPRWDYSNPINTNRNNVNRWIANTYGEKVVPLSDFLFNGALYEAGRAASQADRDAMNVGLMPRSFWANANDTTHMNASGNTVVGNLMKKYAKDGYTYSKAVQRFDVNSTANISTSGGRITVSGHAFDMSDMYIPTHVGITVNGQWHAVLANQPSNNLHAYGIPGAHGYSMSVDRGPGTYTICTVGVNFLAGKENLPPCQKVTIKKVAAPVGGVMTAPAGSNIMQFAGWTYAPDSKTRNLPVAILVDGKWHHVTSANRDSPYLRSSGIPGNHAFWTAAAFSKGEHSMCAVAIESDTNMTNLGCANFTIK